MDETQTSQSGADEAKPVGSAANRWRAIVAAQRESGLAVSAFRFQKPGRVVASDIFARDRAQRRRRSGSTGRQLKENPCPVSTLGSAPWAPRSHRADPAQSEG